MRKSVKRLILLLLMMFLLVLSVVPSAAAAGGDGDTLDVSVTAAWDDDNNDSGDRPDSVSVVLVRDGKDTEFTAVLSGSNGWSATFSNLSASDGAFTVREQVPDGYLAEYAGDAAGGFVITNVKLTEIPDDPIPLAPVDQTPADETNEGTILCLLLALSIVLFIGGKVLGKKRRKQNR